MATATKYSLTCVACGVVTVYDGLEDYKAKQRFSNDYCPACGEVVKGGAWEVKPLARADVVVRVERLRDWDALLIGVNVNGGVEWWLPKTDLQEALDELMVYYKSAGFFGSLDCFVYRQERDRQLDLS